MIDIYGDSFADPNWKLGMPVDESVDTNFKSWYENNFSNKKFHIIPLNLSEKLTSI